MRFMIIEKSRINLPAMISSIFDSTKEAKEYGFSKPKKGQAKIIKIEKGFKLTEYVSRANAPTLEKASQVTKDFKTGKVTLYLKDTMGYCQVENW